ncbi:unnamed protein product [marine sediment metagenome]|uniref:Uncharacterized protein n=1 Tax=marine sediment metagenome TaxID=412755 RepID=X1C806_9ZZZZ
MTMDKESQKKTLANELYMLDNGKHSIDYDAWAGRIILNGYRKFPKDKPPLLCQEDCHQVSNPSDWNMGAEAQRDADIKWYEGEQ